MPKLCDACQEQAATVFITKIVEHKSSKQSLCENCARQRASTEGWMQHLLNGADQFASAPFDATIPDDIMMSLLEQAGAFEALAEEDSDETDLQFPLAPHLMGFGEFPADEDLMDELEDDMAERADIETGPENYDPTEPAPSAPDFFPDDLPARSLQSVRCPKCATTWDRLRQDGRVGCAHCYTVFEEQLRDVMNRVQRAAEHTGKHPRAAEKRRRRLQHLRARRDHRLDMLNRRLQEAVVAEKYEDAAKLRDKIKIVASTIVSDE